MRVAIIGWGKVGKSYHKMFPDAVIYDEPQSYFHDGTRDRSKIEVREARKIVNQCDLALICVPTDLKDGELDTSIVEEVVDWLETPLILIKSALQPGTTDKLVKKTGKKIAVSVELVGEGTYHLPNWKYPDVDNPKKHQLIVVGGETETAERCAEILWDRMSPDIRIHLVTALEAEITKMAENTYGALKVTWGNILKDVCDYYGASFIRVHQAWSEDGRVDPMHTRAVSFKRGWKSKCYQKDVYAFSSIVNSQMLAGMIADNEQHLEMNEKDNSN